MSDSKFIPCGDYAPDLAAFGNLITGSAMNVIPRTRTSYSPMPTFLPAGADALPTGAPLGAFASQDVSGNPGLYVGTKTKLYAQTNASKPNFADRSGATTFAVGDRGAWSFTEMDGYVYASNGTDPIMRTPVAGAADFAAVDAVNAPTAAVIAAIQPGFLICGDINDPTVDIQPQGIRWSALGDGTSWPLIGSSDAIAAQSDWQPVHGPHGRLRAIIPDLATCNAALFFDQAVFCMVYTGDAKIFNIAPVEKMRGTPAARSLAQVGQIVYFLGYDGFYAFDGTAAVPIGEGKVNKSFYADVDPNYLYAVQAVADPTSGLIFWLYAGTGNNNGVANRILVYNPNIGKFAPVSGFSGSSLFLARTFGTTLDGLDALGFTLDTLPYSLDSAVLAGGNVTLGGFDAGNKFGYFSGGNMPFSIETAEVQLAPGRSRVKGVRPAVEGDVCTAAIGSRTALSERVVFDPDNSANADGLIPARNENRYQRVRLSAPAGSLVTHIQGAEVEFSPAGSR